MPGWISDTIDIAPWLGAILALLFAVSWLWQKVAPTLRRWGRILDRLTGVPADPHTGQPEVLGIFERMDRTDRMMVEQTATLTKQDAVMVKQNEVLETIRHEVEFNNGSSVKDAITRTEEQVNKTGEALDKHLAACPTQIIVNASGSQ